MNIVDDKLVLSYAFSQDRRVWEFMGRYHIFGVKHEI
jgi:hypothetical protein